MISEVSISGVQSFAPDVGDLGGLRTKILDFRGFDSSRIFRLRGGILMSIEDLPESLSRAILAGIILVYREIGRTPGALFVRFPVFQQGQRREQRLLPERRRDLEIWFNVNIQHICVLYMYICIYVCISLSLSIYIYIYTCCLLLIVFAAYRCSRLIRFCRTSFASARPWEPPAPERERQCVHTVA